MKASPTQVGGVPEGLVHGGRTRVRSIQPDFTDEILETDQESVTFRHTLNDLRTVIAHWCMLQNDLPDGFADNFEITSAARQVIPAVVIRVQRSSRTLISNLIPFDGAPLSNRRFNPKYLFSLSEVTNRCEFPPELKSDSVLIPGNEGLQVCHDCDGAGENLCKTCTGTGTLSCTVCNSAGQVVCGHCRGQGVILVGGTETQSCPRCRGRATTACSSCSGKGNRKCDACEGGTINCATCASSGQMREQWHLVTLTKTSVYHRLVCRNGWVDDGHEVAVDGVTIRVREWPHPQQLSSKEVQELLPDCLSGASKVCLNSVDLSSSHSEQNTGIRLELQASYAYHVETLQKSENSDFFVTGCSNTVTPRKVTRRRRGFFSRFTDKYTVSPEEQEHVRSVISGRVFLTDTLGLSHELHRLGTRPKVSDTGYIVPCNTNTNQVEIQIHFEYDQANLPIVRAVIDIGNADRHRFPEYMAISQTLAMGILALREQNKGTIERLVLVDSRFYNSTAIKTYHSVLKLLASDAEQLGGSEFPSKPEPRKAQTRALKRICDNIELNLGMISRNGRLSITQGRDEALLTFTFDNGRSQTVLMALRAAMGHKVVELKSRCRTVQSASTIRAALNQNLSSPCGGFALDLSSEPPSIDIVHRLLAIDGEPNYSELIDCVSSIVYRADAIEQKHSNQDQF